LLAFFLYHLFIFYHLFTIIYIALYAGHTGPAFPFFSLTMSFLLFYTFPIKKQILINDFRGCLMRKRRDPDHFDFIITIRKAIKDE